METIVIIQARMGSTRLPGKVLKPLGDSIVLDYVATRCRQIHNITDVIVATSVLKQDDPIKEWCKTNQVTYFRGSEDDVLTRYYECAKSHHPDYVIRVTADCPFVDFDLANDIILAMEKKPTDIVVVEGLLPRGLVVEMISFSALEFIYNHSHESRHREHVTYYAYEYPNQFRQTKIEAPQSMRHSELRITLDTEEDYQLLKAVADHFKNDKLVSSQRVVDYLLENPNVASINAHIQQKPVK